MYYSDFVMGSLCSLIFPVAAPTDSGGLKDHVLWKQLYQEKQKIIIAPVKNTVFVEVLWRGKIAFVKAGGQSKLQ